MNIYSLRNRLICFAIVIAMVLWLVFYTLSILRSEEKELTTIQQSRQVLQVSGPSLTNMQELEALRKSFLAGTADKEGAVYQSAINKLKEDSVSFVKLTSANAINETYSRQLISLIHQMLISASARIDNSPAQPGVAMGTPIIEQYKKIINELEEKSRETLNTSYSRSRALAHQSIIFVIIIIAALLLFIIISFSFIYYEFRNRKAREEELKQYNAELGNQVNEKTALVSEIFERISEGFVALDKDWRYTYVNPKAGKILDRDPQKLIGRHVWTEFPEAIEQPFRKVQEQAMQTQQYGYVEAYYAPAQRWYENHIYPSEKGLSIYFRDITERKEAEEALKSNEQQLKLIYHTTTDVIFLITVTADNKFCFSSVNQAFLESTGLKKEQVIGKYVDEIIPEPSLQIVLRNYKQAIQARRKVQWEEVSEYPAGRKVGIVSVNPVFNDKGECTMLVGVVHDITERKNAEQELVEAEEKFRNLVEQSLMGVYIIQEGKFAYVNPKFAEIFGFRQEELINASPVSVIMPEHRSMVAENVRARVEGEKEMVHYEAKGRRKDGKEIDIEVFCGGTLYGRSVAIIGTLLDITERKETEMEVIKVNERFNLISKATHDAVWDWDMINDTNWGNDIFYSYYGIAPGSPSNNETFLSRVHPDDKQRILEKLDKAIKKKDEVLIDEFRFRMPDGRYRHFFDRAYILYDQQGQPLRMLGSMMDITEKILLEQEISDQKVQAQKMITRAVLKAEEKERNKIGQELHDNVNQILVSVKLFLGMMAKVGDEERSLSLLDKSTRLIETAIQEIRSMSQDQVTPLKESDLEELIKLLIYKIQETSSLKTSFVYDLNGEVIEDDLKLNIYRIVQEQVTNVLKHAEATELEIAIHSVKGGLHISIADNGKGFDATQQRRGIGISNMINRIESFNGELNINSSPSHGCRVDIEIPL
jgi:PAS domain S-box-containing protein